MVKTEERHAPGQVWTCGDPSHNHITKAEAVRCVDQRGALSKAAAAAKPAADAVAQLRNVVDGALAKAGKDPAAIKPDDIQKGLYTLSDLGRMLLQLRSMVCNVDYEEASEADGASKLPQLMRDALKALVAAFRAMSEEETNELLESVATNTAEPDHAATFLYLAAHAHDVLKAGARHSKSDMERIQKAHDMLTDLGAVCQADAAKVDGESDDDPIAKALNERDAEIAELRKVFDQVEPLTKAVAVLGETIETMQADHAAALGAQAEKIAKLEAEPAAPKTALSLHAVEKTQDGNVLPLDDQDAMIERLAKMSDEDRTLLLTKAALARPITLRG